VANILIVVGFILCFMGMSTSDFYVIELGQTEPASVWVMVGIGVVMLIPKLILLLFKGDSYEDYL
jgi:hypothetical protein